MTVLWCASEKVPCPTPLPDHHKQPIWGLREAEFPKRCAAGFTLLAGWCLTSNLRLGDNTTATRIEMQSINEDKGSLDVPFK
jgi:hypothetical protein